tara:strand:- start:1 stop:237 length:237 start_codon:yes stop_codon:yes gene_type:complete
MSETPMKVVVDAKAKTTKYIPLSAEEIAEREAQAIQAEADRVLEEAAQTERDAAMESATEKLAALGLSSEEIAAITGA